MNNTNIHSTNVDENSLHCHAWIHMHTCIEQTAQQVCIKSMKTDVTTVKPIRSAQTSQTSYVFWWALWWCNHGSFYPLSSIIVQWQYSRESHSMHASIYTAAQPVIILCRKVKQVLSFWRTCGKHGKECYRWGIWLHVTLVNERTNEQSMSCIEIRRKMCHWL